MVDGRLLAHRATSSGYHFRRTHVMEENNKLPANMALATDDQKDFNKKVQQIKKKGKEDGGVIYIGHIPHGFFEEQMKDYFSQFGTVKRLRVSRSKKTGKHKGYAFVEFASEAVARIVADTMNNYLMFHRLLKCQFVPYTKLHPETFKGAGRKFKRPKAHLIARDRHNSVKSDRQMKEAERKMLKRKAKTTSKLAEMGIDYDFTISRSTKLSSKPDDNAIGDPSNIQIEYIDESSSDDDEEIQSPSSKRKKTAVQKEKLNEKVNAVQKQKSNEKVKTVTNTKKTEKVAVDYQKRSEPITSPSSKRLKVRDVEITPKNKKEATPKTSVKKTPQTQKMSSAKKSGKQNSSEKKKAKPKGKKS